MDSKTLATPEIPPHYPCQSKMKTLNFQNPPLEERTDLGKSLTFLDLIFLVNRVGTLTSNLTETEKCFLPID
jgi:hypothetical protein